MPKISQYSYLKKIEALKLADEKGVVYAALKLGIPENTIFSWRKRMNRSAKKQTPWAEKEKALLLRAQGLPYSAIAAQLGISKSTAHAWVKAFESPEGQEFLSQ